MGTLIMSCQAVDHGSKTKLPNRTSFSTPESPAYDLEHMPCALILCRWECDNQNISASPKRSDIHLKLPLAPLQLNNTRITESPLKNLSRDVSISSLQSISSSIEGTDSLLMNRSLLTGLPFLPLASRGVSVHISLQFSRIMLQCLSKALTRARILRLFRTEMRTWVWLRTAVWRIERGPAEN